MGRVEEVETNKQASKQTYIHCKQASQRASKQASKQTNALYPRTAAWLLWGTTKFRGRTGRQHLARIDVPTVASASLKCCEKSWEGKVAKPTSEANPLAPRVRFPDAVGHALGAEARTACRGCRRCRTFAADVTHATHLNDGSSQGQL